VAASVRLSFCSLVIEFIQLCRALEIFHGALIDQIAATTRLDPDF
jgi:hypothetical protein